MVKIIVINFKVIIDFIIFKIIYLVEVMVKRLKYSFNWVFGVLGVIYLWDEDILFNGSNNLVEYNGMFYKLLIYVELF